jgi:hypothetical protein
VGTDDDEADGHIRGVGILPASKACKMHAPGGGRMPALWAGAGYAWAGAGYAWAGKGWCEYPNLDSCLPGAPFLERLLVCFPI